VGKGCKTYQMYSIPAFDSKLNVGTEKNTSESFLKNNARSLFFKTYPGILECGVQNCGMIYCAQT